MPIDPSIPLGIKNPVPQIDYIGSLGKLQQIKNERAALPGILAESAVKQDDANFIKWAHANADKHLLYDEKGNVIGLDSEGLGADAAAAGFPKASLSLTAAGLDNQTKVLANMQTQLVNKGYNIANSAAAQNLRANTIKAHVDYMHSWMEQHPQAQADPDAWQKAANDASNMFIQGTERMNKNSGVKWSDIMGPPDKADGTYTFNVADNESYRNMMGPLAEVELKKAKEEFAQFQVGMKGPEARDPNSQVTRNVIKQLTDAGVTVAPGQSAADLYANTTNQAILDANVNPGSSKVPAALGAMVQNTKVNQGQYAIDALRRLSSHFGNSNLSTWVESQLPTLAKDPTWADSVSQLSGYITSHGDMKISAMNPDAAIRAIQTEMERDKQIGNQQHQIATAPTVSAAVESPTVSMKKPNGKIVQVPKEMADRYSKEKGYVKQ